MREDLWSLMAIPHERLGKGSAVAVRVLADADALARAMAEEMAGVIRQSQREGRPACMIVPVGPVGQYEILAEIITEERLDCSRVTFLNMDEFLGEDGGWIDPEHPLSFRGFMDRVFYRKLPASAGVRPECQVFPDPEDLEAIEQVIASSGGVDVCFGGIGLNGHVAFNEPEPEQVHCPRCGSPLAVKFRADEPAMLCCLENGCGHAEPFPEALHDEAGHASLHPVSVEAYAERHTRVVWISAASRAHMAVNLACALDLIPRRAVTVGMREILGSRRISLYANRPWQRGVVRQAVHGPVTPRCPASYLQTHGNASITMAAYVAEAPEVHLR